MATLEIEAEKKMIRTGGKSEEAEDMRPYPQFRLLLTDETWGFHEWDEGKKLIEGCGRIFNVWLIDLAVHHHICSFTPNYEATFLYSVVEKRPDEYDSEDQRWHDLEEKIKELASPENPVEYFTVYDCEKDENPQTAQFYIDPKDALHWVPNLDDTYEDLKENVIEGEAGSPSY